MAYRSRRLDYFYTTVRDRPGEAYELLMRLASGEVNLLAFNTVPMGPETSQLTLFPENPENLLAVAERIGLVLDGPHGALIVHGDDRMGALAEVHERLHSAQIKVYASSAVADGKGCYGYILYVRPEEVDGALHALGD